MWVVTICNHIQQQLNHGRRSPPGRSGHNTGEQLTMIFVDKKGPRHSSLWPYITTIYITVLAIVRILLWGGGLKHLITAHCGRLAQPCIMRDAHESSCERTHIIGRLGRVELIVEDWLNHASCLTHMRAPVRGHILLGELSSL